jgi:hypothetical protein
MGMEMNVCRRLHRGGKAPRQLDDGIRVASYREQAQRHGADKLEQRNAGRSHGCEKKPSSFDATLLFSLMERERGCAC